MISFINHPPKKIVLLISQYKLFSCQIITYQSGEFIAQFHSPGFSLVQYRSLKILVSDVLQDDNGVPSSLQFSCIRRCSLISYLFPARILPLAHLDCFLNGHFKPGFPFISVFLQLPSPKYSLQSMGVEVKLFLKLQSPRLMWLLSLEA